LENSSEILHALERVTSHELLVRADRLRAFLSFVVKQTLAGVACELKESVIAVEVYGKGGDYDPRFNATVRVDARRLREKLQAYYSTAGAADPIQITIPKGGYVPVFVRLEVDASAAAQPATGAPLRRNPFLHRRLAAAMGLASAVLAVLFVRAGTGIDSQSGLGPSPESAGLTAHARHLAKRRTPESLERAIVYAEQASRKTPGDHRSHSVLADAYLSLASFDKSNEEELVRKSVESARRSLALNPSDTESATVLATLEMEKGNWTHATGLFEAAVSGGPLKSSSHARYARLLSVQARHSEAIRQAKNAVREDSLNVPAWAALAQAYMYARDYVSALRAMERGLEIDPAFDPGQLLCARLNVLLGNFTEARRYLSSVSVKGQRRPEYLIAEAWLLAREGKQAQALAAVRSAAGASSIGTATAYAALGQHQEAIDVLRTAVDAGDRDVIYLRVSPGLDPLRSDPRLDLLCEKVRLSGCAQLP
jgi:tetratricopeptide (TPR) repeat protein